jgi:hypothetical protein
LLCLERLNQHDESTHHRLVKDGRGLMIPLRSGKLDQSGELGLETSSPAEAGWIEPPARRRERWEADLGEINPEDCFFNSAFGGPTLPRDKQKEICRLPAGRCD